jgi:nucleotide-binding universal stress UspA family protein
MAGLFRTILSPIDFDANSLKALDTAAELGRMAGATVVVLHVVARSSSMPTTDELDTTVAQEQLAVRGSPGFAMTALAAFLPRLSPALATQRSASFRLPKS